MNIPNIQLFKNVMNAKNPEQLVFQMLEQQASQSDIANNLFTLAKQQNYDAIEEIAKNVCKQNGMDYDSQFKAFMQLLT
jgi:uncharacterized protein Yka (UPF0111/DUF47 family)